jgi:P27 family predicted phage terminase small subunit
MNILPQAPKHLRPKTRKWWRGIAREYQLESHHLKLLTLLAESWDRIQQAREQVEVDGAYIKNRFGDMKAHPALALERQERVVFARLLRELDLDSEPPPEPPRPASLRRYKS